MNAHFGDCIVFNLIYLGLVSNRKEFIRILSEEKTKFKPLGKKVGEFTRQIPIPPPQTTSKSFERKGK